MQENTANDRCYTPEEQERMAKAAPLLPKIEVIFSAYPPKDFPTKQAFESIHAKFRDKARTLARQLGETPEFWQEMEALVIAMMYELATKAVYTGIPRDDQRESILPD